MRLHPKILGFFGHVPLFCLLVIMTAPVSVRAESPLSLGQAQIKATRFSPELQTWQLQKEADLARGRQAGQRPNPQLEIEAENLAGSGEYSGLNTSEWTFLVSQEFDISGKRKLARAVWDSQLDLTDKEFHTAAVDLQEQVGLAFAETWFAQGSLDLAREKLALAQQLIEVIISRVESGGASQLELTRAQVGVAISEIEVVRAEEEMERTSLLLAMFWGASPPDFQRVEIDPEYWLLPADHLTDLTPQENPDITRFESLKKIQASLMQQARKENGVDLDLSLGLKFDRASGDQAFVVGAGIPLPISNKNQFEVQALATELAQLSKRQEGASRMIEGELAAALTRKNGARREITIMTETVLPLARQAFEEASRAHTRGLYSQTDVLETRRTLFELHQADLEARFRYLTATLETARLTGISTIPLAPMGQEAK